MAKLPVRCPVCPVHLDSYESYEASGRLIDTHIIQKHPDYARSLEAGINEKFREPDRYRQEGA